MEMSEEREQSLREAFAEVDTDGSGSIDVQELGVLLKKQVYWYYTCRSVLQHCTAVYCNRAENISAIPSRHYSGT